MKPSTKWHEDDNNQTEIIALEEKATATNIIAQITSITLRPP